MNFSLYHMKLINYMLVSKINHTVQEASKSEELRAPLIVSDCPLKTIRSTMFGHGPVRQLCRFVLYCICIQFVCVYICSTCASWS